MKNLKREDKEPKMSHSPGPLHENFTAQGATTPWSTADLLTTYHNARSVALYGSDAMLTLIAMDIEALGLKPEEETTFRAALAEKFSKDAQTEWLFIKRVKNPLSKDEIGTYAKNTAERIIHPPT